jgi:hypothetical protein
MSSLSVLGVRFGGAKYADSMNPFALFPRQAVEGCLLRVYVSVRTKNGSAGGPYTHLISLPDGWTALNHQRNDVAFSIDNDAKQLWGFWKLATEADIAAGAVEIASSGDRATRAWVVVAEAVADSADPVPESDANGNSGNVSTHQADDLDTTGADDAQILVVTTDHSTEVDGSGLPAGFTSHGSHRVGGSGTTAYEADILVMSIPAGAAGVKGPWTYGVTTADDYCSISSWTRPGASAQELTGEGSIDVEIRFGVGKIDAPRNKPTAETDLADPRANVFPIVKVAPLRGAAVEEHLLGFRRWRPQPGDSTSESAKGRLIEGFAVSRSIRRGSRIGGRGLPTAGGITIANPETIRLDGKRALSDWMNAGRYRWSDRLAEIWFGGYDRHGVRIPPEDWLLVWRGAIAGSPAGDIFRMELEFADAARRFDRLAQTLRFAGTGGLEGGSDWAGKTKPRGAGLVRNAKLAWVDPQEGIGVFHADADGNACREVLAVKSRLNPLTAPGSDQAQYSVALGAVNYIQLQTGLDREEVTIDFVGPAAAGDTCSELLTYFLTTCDGPLASDELDTNALAVFEVENPGQAYHYVPPGGEERLLATIDTLVGPLGWWTIENGLFTCALVADPRRETADFSVRQSKVRAIRKLRVDPELYWLKLAYAKSWTTFDRGQVAEAAFGTEHGEFGIQEHRYISDGDTSIRDDERLAAESDPWSVPIADEADAQALWRRGWELNRVPSEIFELELDLSLLPEVRLGRVAFVTHDAFEATRAGLNLLLVEDEKRHDGVRVVGWTPRERKVLAFLSGKKFTTLGGNLLEIG